MHANLALANQVPLRGADPDGTRFRVQRVHDPLQKFVVIVGLRNFHFGKLSDFLGKPIHLAPSLLDLCLTDLGIVRRTHGRPQWQKNLGDRKNRIGLASRLQRSWPRPSKELQKKQKACRWGKKFRLSNWKRRSKRNSLHENAPEFSNFYLGAFRLRNPRLSYPERKIQPPFDERFGIGKAPSAGEEPGFPIAPRYCFLPFNNMATSHAIPDQMSTDRTSIFY